jgi:hypothetical protein
MNEFSRVSMFRKRIEISTGEDQNEKISTFINRTKFGQ